jgi:hypothetical protein
MLNFGDDGCAAVETMLQSIRDRIGQRAEMAKAPAHAIAFHIHPRPRAIHVANEPPVIDASVEAKAVSCGLYQ